MKFGIVFRLLKITNLVGIRLFQSLKLNEGVYPLIAIYVLVVFASFVKIFVRIIFVFGKNSAIIIIFVFIISILPVHLKERILIQLLLFKLYISMCVYLPTSEIFSIVNKNKKKCLLCTHIIYIYVLYLHHITVV